MSKNHRYELREAMKMLARSSVSVYELRIMVAEELRIAAHQDPSEAVSLMLGAFVGALEDGSIEPYEIAEA